MSSLQQGLKREDAETILNILKKYGSPYENSYGDCDENGELEIKYLYCHIKISDFDKKNDEEILNNMYIQVDTN